jgi:ELWxxDGT repeat protein
MKKQYSFKYLFLLLLIVSISAALQAQNFKLIDVNKTKNSDPNNYQFSSKNMFAELNGDFYFQANDGVNGTELYASNGTAKGTRLVKDINPGTASSYPFDIIASGDKIYFVTSDNTNNQKLWISDGTNAGTQLLDALPASNNFSYLQYLTDVNGILYFNYNYVDDNFISYYQIWKTDGTAPGTVLVANLYGSVNLLVNVNGRLFFTSTNYNDGTGTELYTSDGTDAGTVMVADINPNPYTGSNPTHLTAVNGLLYFAADDGTGTKLWVSNGSATGTHAVKNGNNIFLAPGYGFEIDPFAIRDKTLFFQGYEVNSTTLTTTGNELCKYNTADTTLHHVTLVKNIMPGEKNSYPSFITNVNGTLFFTIGPDNADAQLWKSDGTSAGTVLIKNINPGGINNYYGLTNMNGTLLFAFGNDALGTELWKSNGTSAGTVIVKDIFPGAYSSYPRYITYRKGIFIFGADGLKGIELWRSNGTEGGTVMVKNINDITTSSSSPSGFSTMANNKIIFTANDGKNPGNLFVTDGTDANTKWVGSDASHQHLYSSNQDFVTLKNTTYFLDWSNRLWKTNGTKAGTSMLPIPAFADNQTGYITNFAVTDNLLYIFSYDYMTGQTIMWRTDGTAAGTFILKSDLAYYYNLYPTAIGKTLFFAGSDNNTGFSALWKTDGTVAGTVMVKTNDYNPLANLYNFKGKLYFSAYTPENSFGPSFWTSDGTEAGTKVVKAVAVLQQPFAQANGKLFFYAIDAISKGYELFASDGTARGTRLVKDINKGPASSFVNSLISGDAIVYFMADDGKHGLELWKSNGTKEGTGLVKNITPGINSSSVTQMVNAKDKLFFTVNDTLWQSDGTKKNTHPVKDASLKGVIQLSGLTAIGDNLYFSGYTYEAGQELYTGGVASCFAPAEIFAKSALASPKINDAFTARLLTNPVTDQLKFTVTVKDQQAAQIMIADVSGRKVVSLKQNLSPGTNMFSYDAKSWGPGMYMIQIVTADGSWSSLKAVKIN